jgi:hypothetical protein
MLVETPMEDKEADDNTEAMLWMWDIHSETSLVEELVKSVYSGELPYQRSWVQYWSNSMWISPHLSPPTNSKLLNVESTRLLPWSRILSTTSHHIHQSYHWDEIKSRTQGMNGVELQCVHSNLPLLNYKNLLSQNKTNHIQLSRFHYLSKMQMSEALWIHSIKNFF